VESYRKKEGGMPGFMYKERGESSLSEKVRHILDREKIHLQKEPRDIGGKGKKISIDSWTISRSTRKKYYPRGGRRSCSEGRRNGPLPAGREERKKKKRGTLI